MFSFPYPGNVKRQHRDNEGDRSTLILCAEMLKKAKRSLELFGPRDKSALTEERYTSKRNTRCSRLQGKER